MEYKTLNNGMTMPAVGFGTYQIPASRTEQAVLEALEAGYRHIDTARNYGNEREVGKAIRKSGLNREEIFLTTKIYGAESYAQAARYIDDALEKLDTDYIDLLLFHWPSGNISQTWKAMEDAVKQGKVRAIGVSNFFEGDFSRLLRSAQLVPAVNQVEAHVFHQRRKLQPWMESRGCVLEAWSPLASGKNHIFQNPVLIRIGKNHGKSSAQIALKFLLQKGICILPKSVSPRRIRENIDLFDFELTPKEMEEIAALDLNRSLFGWYE